jgi:hypothetical protein
VSDPGYPRASGWSSSFHGFQEASVPYIRQSLIEFLEIVSPEQVNAWTESIPPLQLEMGEVVGRTPAAADYSAILEYQLPMEHRRPDVILLLGDGVLVLELKSKSRPDLADLDQASGYARDLRAYHRECEDRTVSPALVLMRAHGRLGRTEGGVEIIGPDALDDLVADLDREVSQAPINRRAFLDADAYRPMPTIVQAARQLMELGELPRIKRPNLQTRATLEYLSGVVHEAAANSNRHLVLLSGLPGTGKTLVGLQLAHARFLDDLSVERIGGKPTAPAVYLSGNGPLVDVLQYELGPAGGGGAAFVRRAKAYVERYSEHPDLVPPEHVLIFDEAQRAFDAAQVAETHRGRGEGRTEPEHFIEFAERVPAWSVVVGLIGSGQEIHVGEEAGMEQWKSALERFGSPGAWTVHAPLNLSSVFEGLPTRIEPALHLTTELRYHLAEDIHDFVEGLLGEQEGDLPRYATALEQAGYHLRITRSLEAAKAYLQERYDDAPMARFGIVASSRDGVLSRFNVPNDYQSTKRIRYGPWYGEGDDDPQGRSCRTLQSCVTEFGCQGLELDAVLLAWGNDLIREGNAWTNRLAKRYQRANQVRDAMQLRRNAYRVLLTRGRDGVVVFVPPLPILDETYAYLVSSGFRDLGDVG